MPPESPTDELIGTTVRALAAGRGLTHADVANAVAIPRSTFERRMAKGGWTADEATRLASTFDITIDDLTSGLNGLLLAEPS
ncbi:MAG: hypothetical protein ACRDO7_15700 [Nocardioidaceae bacterium]